MEDIRSNTFFVSKKEDVDKFVQLFMNENKCCDRVEINDKNDSWEVIFFKKQEKKVEGKRMAFKDIFQQAADEMEREISEVKKQAEEAKKSMEEQTRSAKKNMDQQMAAIQDQAKKKLAEIDQTVAAKFTEQEKKFEEKLCNSEQKSKGLIDSLTEKIRKAGQDLLG